MSNRQHGEAARSSLTRDQALGANRGLAAMVPRSPGARRADLQRGGTGVLPAVHRRVVPCMQLPTGRCDRPGLSVRRGGSWAWVSADVPACPGRGDVTRRDADDVGSTEIRGPETYVGLLVVTALTDHRGKDFVLFKGGSGCAGQVAVCLPALDREGGR
jgi:hypothetical protein